MIPAAARLGRAAVGISALPLCPMLPGGRFAAWCGCAWCYPGMGTEPKLLWCGANAGPFDL